MKFRLPTQFDSLFPPPPFDVRELDGDAHEAKAGAILTESVFWADLLQESSVRLRDALARDEAMEVDALRVALASACAALRRSGLGAWVERHDADLHRAVRLRGYDERYQAALRILGIVKRAAAVEVGDDPADADFVRAYAFLAQHGDEYDLPSGWTDLVPTAADLARLMGERPSRTAERVASRLGLGGRGARKARKLAKAIRGLMRFQVLRGR